MYIASEARSSSLGTFDRGSTFELGIFLKLDPFGEDTSLLYPKRHGLSENFEAPIIRGVANQLRKWPADLSFVFLAVCLVLGCLVLLVFVTVIICLPTVVANRCRYDSI